MFSHVCKGNDILHLFFPSFVCSGMSLGRPWRVLWCAQTTAAAESGPSSGHVIKGSSNTSGQCVSREKTLFTTLYCSCKRFIFIEIEFFVVEVLE